MIGRVDEDDIESAGEKRIGACSLKRGGSKSWRRRPIRALNLCHAVTPIEFCYRSVPASMTAVALHGLCIRACPALLTDMNCMAHIRLFLYFSGLTFTWRPSRHNQLARVSKSRNGDLR